MTPTQIQRLRNRLDLTQEEFGKLVAREVASMHRVPEERVTPLGRSQISRWERGQSTPRDCRMIALEHIATRAGYTRHLEGKPEGDPPEPAPVAPQGEDSTGPTTPPDDGKSADDVLAEGFANL